MKARTSFPWISAFAYAAVTAAITVALLTFVIVTDEDSDPENNPEKFVSGDKDQDNILGEGEGSCPPKQMKTKQGSCDPITMMLPKKKRSCRARLEEGVKVAAFESTQVAALAADAAFSINDVLRGDGACLKAVAERAEEDEALAREAIETSDGGILMARLVEYRNREDLLLHCSLDV